MKQILFAFLIFYSGVCFSQKQTIPTIYILNPDLHIKDDTLADGSYGFVIDNIDGDFLTSVALLYYSKTNSLMLSSKNLKNKIIKYEDLISTIKKNKNDFFIKFEYYILEPDKKGYFKAHKVFNGEYFEVKDKSGFDILSDF